MRWGLLRTVDNVIRQTSGFLKFCAIDYDFCVGLAVNGWQDSKNG